MGVDAAAGWRQISKNKDKDQTKCFLNITSQLYFKSGEKSKKMSLCSKDIARKLCYTFCAIWRCNMLKNRIMLICFLLATIGLLTLPGCLTSRGGIGFPFKIYGWVYGQAAQSAASAKSSWTGIANIPLYLTGSAESATVSTAGTENGDGYFEFTSLAAGTYTVTPSKEGKVFSPPSYAVIIVASNESTGIFYMSQ